jgi:hypothetical protein
MSSADLTSRWSVVLSHPSRERLVGIAGAAAGSTLAPSSSSAYRSQSRILSLPMFGEITAEQQEREIELVRLF